jgi:hypothetical protein
MTTSSNGAPGYPLSGLAGVRGLCPAYGCKGCVPLWADLGRDDLAMRLGAVLDDPMSMAVLRRAADECGEQAALWRQTDASVVDQVAALIEGGRLRMCGAGAAERPGGGGGGGGGGDPRPAPPAPPVPRPPRPRPPEPPPGPPPGNLIVHVRAFTAAGDPIESAKVDISGASTGSSNTNAADAASFMSIAPGTYTVKARKDQHVPDPAETSAAVSAGATTHVTLVLKPDVVTQIKARVRGTHGVRKPATDLRAANVLKASSSADESLSGNPPVILVRGCHSVDLEAVTDRPNQPVTWSVVANENTDAPPTITPKDGGRKATLRTNVHGSFSVIATLNASKVVWNVVFVWVKVDVASSVVITRNNYAGTGPGGFASGPGTFASGTYTWEATVNVKVVGGGNSKRLGTDKVKVHVLQNGVADTLRGHYAPPPPGANALEVPIGGLPIVDSNGGVTPVLTNANSVSVTPSNTAFERTVFTGDSPAGGFALNHQNTGTRLQSISGINGFQATIVGVSDEAKNSFIVHARIAWRADFSGTIDAAGNYTPTTANTTSDAAYVLVSAGTGGQDAADAKMETFQPRFNQGTNTTWTP